MNNAVFIALEQATLASQPVALGIITNVKGSSPQKVGAKALFYPDGRIRGTMGGGCLEAEIQHRAIQALRSGQASTFELVLDHDFGWDDGLICGGKVCGVILPNARQPGAEFWNALAHPDRPVSWSVSRDFVIAHRDAAPDSGTSGDWLYEETVTPPCVMWIAGAGHIAQAVAPIAAQLDFDVTVFDDRPALASPNYFPPEVALRVGLWEELCAMAPPARPSFGLIVTRGHRHDALVLKSWIHQPFLFLGMIGSARKARTIHEHFMSEQLASAEDWLRVACPVGLPIHSKTVPEIAVSILAQFIQKRAELVYEKQGYPEAKAEIHS
jgi:xanthine dehydrogenase accessory factor